MLFSELKTALYEVIREESGNSAFTDTEISRWINRAYNEIWISYPWSFRKTTTVLTNVFTSCSDAGDSTGTTLYVDSSSGMTIGMELIVNDTCNYETVTIAAISGNTITLESPGLISTYEDGGIVAGAHLYLPYNCQKVLDILCMEINTSSQSFFLS